MSHKAVFLDKDGTLVDDVPYNVNPDRIVLTAGVLAALQQLQQAGYLLIVITNQSGVARGFFPESALAVVWLKLQSLFASAGVVLTDFYYCPHHPEGLIQPYAIACQCRKPQPGLLLQAAQDHDIDLSQSWMIGDILHDVAAGREAGCRTILLDNGNETEWDLTPARSPHFQVHCWADVAQTILTQLVTDPLPQPPALMLP